MREEFFLHVSGYKNNSTLRVDGEGFTSKLKKRLACSLLLLTGLLILAPSVPDCEVFFFFFIYMLFYNLCFAKGISQDIYILWWLQVCLFILYSWRVRKMLLMKFATATVLMWNFSIWGSVWVVRTGGRSLECNEHSVNRCLAVCGGFSGQLHRGDGALLILWRYVRKLPWLVRNWVRM